jgi:lipid II:glycine glycyltransferase (peptidoglycan interpeptide bridge formation enzyme)
MWGVYRFKEGLGGQLVRGLGAWDYPVRPLLSSFYLQALPRRLALMRRRGRARAQRVVSR